MPYLFDISLFLALPCPLPPIDFPSLSVWPSPSACRSELNPLPSGSSCHLTCPNDLQPIGEPFTCMFGKLSGGQTCPKENSESSDRMMKRSQRKQGYQDPEEINLRLASKLALGSTANFYPSVWSDDGFKHDQTFCIGKLFQYPPIDNVTACSSGFQLLSGNCVYTGECPIAGFVFNPSNNRCDTCAPGYLVNTLLPPYTVEHVFQPSDVTIKSRTLLDSDMNGPNSWSTIYRVTTTQIGMINAIIVHVDLRSSWIPRDIGLRLFKGSTLVATIDPRYAYQGLTYVNRTQRYPLPTPIYAELGDIFTITYHAPSEVPKAEINPLFQVLPHGIQYLRRQYNSIDNNNGPLADLEVSFLPRHLSCHNPSMTSSSSRLSFQFCQTGNQIQYGPLTTTGYSWIEFELPPGLYQLTSFEATLSQYQNGNNDFRADNLHLYFTTRSIGHFLSNVTSGIYQSSRIFQQYGITSQYFGRVLTIWQPQPKPIKLREIDFNGEPLGPNVARTATIVNQDHYPYSCYYNSDFDISTSGCFDGVILPADQRGPQFDGGEGCHSCIQDYVDGDPYFIVKLPRLHSIQLVRLYNRECIAPIECLSRINNFRMLVSRNLPYYASWYFLEETFFIDPNGDHFLYQDTIDHRHDPSPFIIDIPIPPNKSRGQYVIIAAETLLNLREIEIYSSSCQ